MRGNNCVFAKPWAPRWPTYALNWCSPCCSHKHYNPEQIVSTLAFDLKRGLKIKVDKFELLLRYLLGYNSVCLLKPATPFRLPGRLNLERTSCCFKNIRHLQATKGRSLDETEVPPLKVWMRGLIAQSKHFTSKVKLLRSPFLGLFMFPFI